MGDFSPCEPLKPMATQTLNTPQTSQPSSGMSEVPNGVGRVYVISFDMDIDRLKIHYGDPYNKAYSEIRKVLLKRGFAWQQGSVSFGGESINAVTCVLAAIELSTTLPWFAASVRDIRMLRIEEFNDLMPAVQQAVPDA